MAFLALRFKLTPHNRLTTICPVLQKVRRCLLIWQQTRQTAYGAMLQHSLISKACRGLHHSQPYRPTSLHIKRRSRIRGRQQAIGAALLSHQPSPFHHQKPAPRQRRQHHQLLQNLILVLILVRLTQRLKTRRLICSSPSRICCNRGSRGRFPRTLAFAPHGKHHPAYRAMSSASTCRITALS